MPRAGRCALDEPELGSELCLGLGLLTGVGVGAGAGATGAAGAGLNVPLADGVLCVVATVEPVTCEGREMAGRPDTCKERRWRTTCVERRRRATWADERCVF